MAKCPNCGNIVADTSEFCSDCGQDLNGVGGEVSTDGSTVTATSSSDKNMYYLGVVLGILGVVFFGTSFSSSPCWKRYSSCSGCGVSSIASPRTPVKTQRSAARSSRSDGSGTSSSSWSLSVSWPLWCSSSLSPQAPCEQ